MSPKFFWPIALRKSGPALDDDYSLLEYMFVNCPILEDLTIIAGLSRFVSCDINIFAPKMKLLRMNLKLENFEEISEEEESEEGECEEEQYNIYIYINAPQLVNFHLKIDDLAAFQIHVNANSNFKADIVLYLVKKQNDSEIEILDMVSSVKHLSLSASRVFEVSPDFDNLIHLKLNAPFHFNCWVYLIEFLKRSPNLEYLVIEPHKSNCPHDEFNPPEFVPVCMLSRLKTITFESFKGRHDEMRVAKYLLKYSEVLNKMTIKIASNGLRNVEVQTLCKEISMFEMASKTCKVEIN